MRYNPRTGRHESTTPSGEFAPPDKNKPVEWTDIPKNKRKNPINPIPTTTTTVPTTVPPKKTSTTTVPPKKTSTTTVPPKKTNTPPLARGQIVPVLGEPDTEPEGGGLSSELYQLLYGQSSGGGSNRADIAAERKRLEQTGRSAQREYNTLGQKGYQTDMASIAPRYDSMLNDLTNYYTKAGTTAQGSIDAATKSFLEQLLPSTAYTGLPDTAVAAPQQGLMEALGTYGATGNLAGAQQTADAGFSRQLADLTSKSQGQMATAQQQYLDALRTAGVGGQTAATQGLASLLAGMQGQERAAISGERRQEEAEAERRRREMIMAGIQARMAGRGL
jgi:hypothetical protein